MSTNGTANRPTVLYVEFCIFFLTQPLFLHIRRPRPPGIPIRRPSKDPIDSEVKEDNHNLIAIDGDVQKTNLESNTKMALLRSPLLAANPFADVEFVALARIFSGRVFPGQRLFVLGPKFDGRKVSENLPSDVNKVMN